MARLCSVCSSLHIEKADVTNIRKQLERDPEAVISHSLRNINSELVVRTLNDLVQSSGGTQNNPKCHLCVLLLQSLPVSLEEEYFTLEIVFSKSGISLIARSGNVHGEALTLALNTGQFSALPNFVAYDFIDETCRGAEVASSALSTQVLSTIKTWSEDCRGHKRCSHDPQSWLPIDYQSWLPTRVIDVGNIQMRLCQTSGITGRYITLSHRWSASTAVSSTTLLTSRAVRKDSNFRIYPKPFRML